MSDLLQLVPIYTFMLIPVWIPLVTAAFGLVSDAIKAPARAVAHHDAGLSPAGPQALAAGTAR